MTSHKSKTPSVNNPDLPVDNLPMIIEGPPDPISQAVLIEALGRELDLAQTEIKGHMRIEDDLKVRIAELESILRLYQRGRHGWDKEGMLAGEWLKIQEQFDAAVSEALKSRA